MYDKYYFEEYARLSLIDIFPQWKNNILHSDKPDLQNKIDDIGIEVTSSTPSIICEKDSYGEKRMGLYFTEGEKHKILNDFEGSAYFDENNKLTAYSTTKGSITPKYAEQINDILEVKIIKMKKYLKFNKNGIYVFTDTGTINENDIKSISKLDFIKKFDFVFVNLYDEICLFHKDCYTTYSVSNDKLKEYKQKAKEHAKEHKMNNAL